MLLEYLMNNMPEELYALSTHTMIQYVSDVDNNSIRIRNEEIKVEGTANLEVELLHGSESDRSEDDSINDSFDFVFRESISNERIIKAYFKFDLESFYK